MLKQDALRPFPLCGLMTDQRCSRCALFACDFFFLTTCSHASIPAHLRAERGLPEDLIRLCIGIEDPTDLIDDLESSLLASGAIRPRGSASSIPTSSPSDSPTVESVIARASQFQRTTSAVLPPLPITDTHQAEELLASELKTKAQISSPETSPQQGQQQHQRPSNEQEVVVSAPGKVILFGEHAVVHGVVSD